MLAERALSATDPTGIEAERENLEGRAAYLDHVGETLHFNAVENYAYLQETVERLRRYEPEWLTLEQHKDARRAAEDAASAAKRPEAPRAPDAAANPDRDRVAQEARRAARSNSGKQVMASDACPATTSCDDAPSSDEHALPVSSDPPGRRGRGAKAGNSHTLKNGRHTAPMREQLAEDRQMSRQVRDLCAEVDRFTASLAAGRAKSDAEPADSP